jgi:homocysteine S-methyltransferase
MSLLTYLKEHQLVTDGAMGTYYGEKYGSFRVSPEQKNQTQPEQILAIHKEYLTAGARFIRTNSFSSNLKTLFPEQTWYDTKLTPYYQVMTENIKSAYQIAAQAVLESGADAIIAGDIGPLSEQIEREEAEIRMEYQVMVDALLDAGAKLLLFETFSDYQDILPAARHAKEKKPEVVIIASFCLNKFGYTRSGLSSEGILQIAAQQPEIDGVGFNCGIGSTHMYQIIKKLDLSDQLLMVIPNSGYPDIIKDRRCYQENASFFCENMKDIASLGVNLLGGCCGTTPDYIRGLASHITGTLPSRKTVTRVLQSSMRIQKENNSFYTKLHSGKMCVVAELEPPHNGDSSKIIPAALQLKQAGVDLITCSDSPMGKMRADAMMTAAKIQRELEITTIPHITCRDRNRLGLGAAFMGAHMNGLRNLLIITGDPVAPGDRSGVTPVFDFHSIKLMEYVKQMNIEYFSADPFIYGGAINQGRPNFEKELARIEQKEKAGADFFLTQPIYDHEDLVHLAQIKRRVKGKILCGIMPLVSYRNAMFMKNEVYGIHVPDEIVARYHKDMSRAQGEEVGIQIAMEIVTKLTDIADGFYFMIPFNRAAICCEIMKRMKERCLI